MRRCRGLAVGVAALVVAAAIFVSAGAADAQTPAPPTYRPPVDGAVVDGFRLGTNPYGAGNRGVDYETEPGQPVTAAAGGVVTYAGAVGGALHVVVLHPDGIRTSYSFLADVAVKRGQHVVQGQIVGHAARRVHWGARAGDAYLDPTRLLSGPPAVHLVPDAPPQPASAEAEGSSLRRYLGNVFRTPKRVAGWAVGWARRGTGAVVGAGRSALGGLRSALDHARLLGLPNALRVMTTAFQNAFRECTEDDVPTPRVSGRRIIVQVAGLGSKANGGSVLDIDAAGLGYAPADIHQFSYRGGTVADTTYGPADTVNDIYDSAVELRVLIRRLRRENPTIPIDVVAHSQGGLVARAALGDNPDGVDHFVTLASPHNGSIVATMGGYVRGTPFGDKIESVGSRLMGYPLDGTSVAQLSETSDFIDANRRRPVPDNLRMTSIGAANDVIVPAFQCVVDGATNVIVHSDSINGHADLPGSEAGRREVALALTNHPPGCVDLVTAVGLATMAEAVDSFEHLAALGLGAAGAVSALPVRR